MWNPVVLLVLGLCSFTYAVPLGLKKNMAIVQQEEEPMMMMAADEETRPEVMISRLNLPSNATSIRADITDGFSCDNKTYGYYADVENDCQIFHVCLPVTYADGKENTFRWSFICPEETVFSQDSFTCMRPADMSIDCEESFKYYELNRNFGVIDSEDSPSTMDEEMNMEDMSRQPSSQEAEEDIKQMAVAAPVKKQAVKVQTSNRRKTQTNRVAIDAQRRKVQPLRKSPQTVAPTTAKPVEEDAPIMEQEVERTTVKYQRFTKRPVTLVKEPAKPEQFKPEQQLVRTDLFAQKRKRPQIFSTTMAETEPEASQKTEVVLDQQPENTAQDQAEAQASEIAEVSVKPQEQERIAEPVAVPKKEPAYIYIPLEEEIAPMPENIPSRAEVVEIPIQRVDETLIAGAPIPIIDEPMPIADIVATEPVKAEEEKLLNEELLAEQSIQAELTKILEETQNQEDGPVKEGEKTIETPSEAERPVEAEKAVLEPLPEIVQMLEAVKAVALPMETPVQHPVESEVSASDLVKAIETKVKPEVSAEEPLVVETPAKINAPAAEPEVPVKIETESEPLRAEVPPPNLVLESEAAVAEPEKHLETKIPVAEPEMLLKSETPIADLVKTTEAEVPALVPEIPLTLDSAVPEMPLVMEAPVPEMPLVVELPVEAPVELPAELPVKLPVYQPEMTLKIQAPSTPDSVEPLPTADVEAITKTAVTTADKPAQIEIPAEPMSEQSPEPLTPVEAELPPQPMSQEPQIQIEAEKSSEMPAEEAAPQSSEQMEAQPQSTGVQSSAAESQDTQSLILDFISSLVNSENSNLEEQSKPMDEEQAASMPVPAIAMADEKPAEIKADPEQPKPMYVPMVQDNEQMYQIPVQIIETPEPEPLPVAAEPKLPPSIDDVVELVKESLDTPAEKENLIQEPLAASSDEVKPIYHRYIELDSNLLKSEALTASDEDEPTVIAAAINDDTAAPQDQAQKLVEQLPQPEQLASVPEPIVNSNPLPAETAAPTEDRLPMSRSLNRFRMDPRKRRFLFRSDAS